MWKTIPGFENYEASEEGQIRCTTPGIPKVPKRQKEDRHGYLEVRICVGKGRKIAKRVHRLVAAAWIPNPHNKSEVNHMDGNKKNNHISNLEWATRKENAEHAKKIGRYKNAFGGKEARGESHPRSKLKTQDVVDIMRLKGTKTAREIADYFNVSLKTVQSIHYRWRWKHVTDSLVDAFNKPADPEQ